MKSKFFKGLLVLLMVTAIIWSPSQSSAESNQTSIDYLALGDSLAAGWKPTGGIGEGYSDFIAQQLHELKVLESFDKRFAVPAYTTTNVLNDILANVSKADNSGNTTDIHAAISKSEIITLDAGANDVLKEIHIDPQTATITYDPAKLQAAFQTVSLNTEQILKKITDINPNAKVYLMGYYNPFPRLPKEQTAQLQQLLITLNGVIQQAGAKFGAVFVPTSKDFNANALDYLPISTDIHPNTDGYLVLANAFWRNINLNKEITFNDTIPAWAEQDVNYLAQKGLIEGYENGNFGAKDNILRFHSALLIKRSIIFDHLPSPNPNYKDIPTNFDGYDAIAKLSEKGIFNGYKGYYYPSAALTRAEMAKVIVDAFHLTGTTDETFTDVKTHWGATYINTLAANKIVLGYKDGSFRPNEKITRAEFSVMLAKVLQK